MPAAYDRAKAVAYAKRWALSRNPAYLNFHAMGGDCTNFVSQCLYAGCGTMNFTPVTGWYYRTGNDRTASWTGVEYLYRFLMGNQGAGPYAREVGAREAAIGDIVQLARLGQRFTHAAIIVAIDAAEIYVACHTTDAWMKPLRAFAQPVRRFVHIAGVRG